MIFRERSWMCVALCLCSVAASPKESHYKPPVAPQVMHFTGRFLGFSEGDYVYAGFCVADSVVYLGVSESIAAFFAAAHPGAQIEVTAKLISEPGWQPVEYGFVGASIGGYTSEAWWADAQRALGSRAYDVFNALEESLTDTTTQDCGQFSRKSPR